MNFFMALIREHVPTQEKLAAAANGAYEIRILIVMQVFIVLSMH